MQTIQELKAELQRLTDAVNEYAKHLEEKEREGIDWVGVKLFERDFFIATVEFRKHGDGVKFHKWLRAYLTLRQFMQGKSKWECDDYNRAPIYHRKTGRFIASSNRLAQIQPKWLYSDEETIRELIAEHDKELRIFFEVSNE